MGQQPNRRELPPLDCWKCSPRSEIGVGHLSETDRLTVGVGDGDCSVAIDNDCVRTRPVDDAEENEDGGAGECHDAVAAFVLTGSAHKGRTVPDSPEFRCSCSSTGAFGSVDGCRSKRGIGALRSRGASRVTRATTPASSSPRERM